MHYRKFMKKMAGIALAISMGAGLCACGQTETGGDVASGAAEKTEEASGNGETGEVSPSKFYDEEGDFILPLSDGSYTYKILWEKDPNDVGTIEDKEILMQALEATGIKIEVEEVSSQGWEERLSVLFASGDLPDVICGPINNIENFTDLCLDITDMLPEYAPWMYDFMYNQEPSVARAEAVGGRLYSLPQVRINGVYPRYFWSINKTWLERVGMDVPTTTDELYEVLKAFKEQDANGNGDPNDEIPYSFFGLDNNDGLYSWMNMFGLINDGANRAQQYVMVEDGKVLFVPTDERFYAMLQYLNKLYAEGLLDPDGMVQEYVDRTAKGTADLLGFVNAAGLFTVVTGDEVGEDFTYLLPPESEYGSVIQQNDPAGELAPHIFTITKACEHPEELLVMCEWMNSTQENRFVGRFGPEGAGWVFDEEGKRENQTDFTGKTYSNRSQASMTTGGQNRLPIFCTLEEEMMRGYSGFSVEYNEFGMNDYGPDGGHAYEEGFPLGNDSMEAAAERAQMFSEIDTYIQNFVAESVTTGIDDGKWEAHIKNCEALNVEGYVQNFQSLYDTLMS